ncbi:XdhC family protein [Veronia pacifica]|uniref:XdhC /CoxI family-like protein n=1 Tax=Veronia pacifica TaxID=1080227 RepID=A0A1C3EE93_9GAMM|nr:XdhC family protein [Veronia pacifica]ODA31577.1 hypothetical protein A8L45_16350 [Veronia pacifica]
MTGMYTEATFLNEVQRLVEQGAGFVTATVVRVQGSSSGNKGDSALVVNGEIKGWIGGGCAQPAVKKAARWALDEGKPLLIRVGPEGERANAGDLTFLPSHCASEGILDIFIQPYNCAPTLLVFGSTPTAAHIAHFALSLSYQVRMFAKTEVWPSIPDSVMKHDFADLSDEAMPSTGGVHIFSVVATQGQGDMRALKAALNTDSSHILLVASRKKAASMMGSLADEGISEASLSRIISPAGLELAAVTQQEIAISVVAQLVKLHRTDVDHSGDTAQSDGDEVPEKPTTAGVSKEKKTSKKACCHGN